MQDGQPVVWSTYFATDDVDALAERVTEFGGQSFFEPMDVMDAGRMGFFAHPAAGAFGGWQPGNHKGAELVNEPVSLAWNTLITPAPEDAAAFFGLRRSASAPRPSASAATIRAPHARRARGRRPDGPAARMPEGAPAFWGVSFAVEDADATAALAVERGGTMLSEPMDMPGIGRIATVTDPWGASFSVAAARQLRTTGRGRVARPRARELRVLDAAPLARRRGSTRPRRGLARRAPRARTRAPATACARLPAATPRPPTRDHAWPRRLYLLAEREPPGLALPEHARRVRVASAPVVAFGLDQHVLAQRATGTDRRTGSDSRRLEVLRRPDRPPPWRVGHPLMVAIQRPGVVHPLRLAGCEPAWRSCRPRSPCELWIGSRPGAGRILVLIPPSSFRVAGDW